MRKILAILVWGALLSPSVADEATKASKIQELMKLKGLTEISDQARSARIGQAEAMAPRVIEDFRRQAHEIPEEAIKQATKRFHNAVEASWSTDEAIEVWQELYGADLTEDEIDQAIAFYRSPIGQKDIAATKAALPRWSQFLGKKNASAIDDALKAYVADLNKAIASGSSN